MLRPPFELQSVRDPQRLALVRDVIEESSKLLVFRGRDNATLQQYKVTIPYTGAFAWPKTFNPIQHVGSLYSSKLADDLKLESFLVYMGEQCGVKQCAFAKEITRLLSSVTSESAVLLRGELAFENGYLNVPHCVPGRGIGKWFHSGRNHNHAPVYDQKNDKMPRIFLGDDNFWYFSNAGDEKFSMLAANRGPCGNGLLVPPPGEFEWGLGYGPFIMHYKMQLLQSLAAFQTDAATDITNEETVIFRRPFKFSPTAVCYHQFCPRHSQQAIYTVLCVAVRLYQSYEVELYQSYKVEEEVSKVSFFPGGACPRRHLIDDASSTASPTSTRSCEANPTCAEPRFASRQCGNGNHLVDNQDVTCATEVCGSTDHCESSPPLPTEIWHHILTFCETYNLGLSPYDVIG
jgi:hypothetical protein